MAGWTGVARPGLEGGGKEGIYPLKIWVQVPSQLLAYVEYKIWIW